MPAFLKNPKVIAGAIISAWVAYVLWANWQPKSFDFYLFPYAILQFKISTLIIGSAIFGALLSLVIQYQWRRYKSSNSTAVSSAADSNKTVA